MISLSAPAVPPPIIVLAGPTGVGKTELSLALAEEFKAEIISMDSMQIYRYMDIGSAKPTLAERNRVRHHLVDYVEPDEEYHVSRFVMDAGRAIADMSDRGCRPMLVGGTGLYLRSLLQGVCAVPPIPEEIRSRVRADLQEFGTSKLYNELQQCDPHTAARIHANDSQRLARGVEIFRATGVPWSRHLARQKSESDRFAVVKIGLTRERHELYERINARVGIMVDQGLLAEVEGLLAKGYSPGLPAMQAIGYRHMVNYIKGIWSWDEALQLLARDTRHYAKRQFTWFNREADMHWFHPDDHRQIRELIVKK